MIRNSFSHSFSSLFLYCANFCSVFARADLLTVTVLYSLCLAHLTIGSKYKKYRSLEAVALRNLRKVLSTTKLPPKIPFSSTFCVKYININVLSQLNVTTSLKCKYKKCCFLFIVVVSHFFCFSESKYMLNISH